MAVGLSGLTFMASKLFVQPDATAMPVARRRFFIEKIFMEFFFITPLLKQGGVPRSGGVVKR